MKILVVSQYFWPENFRINDLCLSLKEKGHEVTVLTGCPNYPKGAVYPDFLTSPLKYKNYEGIEIIRVPMLPRKKGAMALLLNYLSFMISGSINGLYRTKNKEFDLVFVCQLSPVTAAIPAIVIKKFRRIPLVMWSLDLWPESLQAVGQVNSKAVLSVVGRLVTFIYSQCDMIIGQSESYLDTIKKRDKSNTEMALFPNWAEDLFTPSIKETNNSCFNILFAGNVGEAQNFEVVIEAAVKLKNKQKYLTFTIVGDGRKLAWFKEEVEKHNVQNYFVFHGQQPLGSMPSFYAKADAALVCLKSSDIFKITVPGKVQSYMVSSLPILSVLDGEGKLLVEKANCGLACNASDSDSFVSNVLELMDLPNDELQKLGANGLKYAKEHFSKDKLVKSLEGWFDILIKR